MMSYIVFMTEELCLYSYSNKVNSGVFGVIFHLHMKETVL